jgi:hypothetical protein
MGRTPDTRKIYKPEEITIATHAQPQSLVE